MRPLLGGALVQFVVAAIYSAAVEAGSCVYVAGEFPLPECDGSVFVFDGEDLDRDGHVPNVEQVEVGAGPVAVAIHSATQQIFSVNQCGDGQCSGFDQCRFGSLSVIDANTNVVTKTLPLGAFPKGITFSSHGHAYVFNGCGDAPQCTSPPTPGSTVTVVDLESLSVLGDINYGRRSDLNCGPKALAISPDGSTVYISCDTELKIIDAEAIALDPDCLRCAVLGGISLWRSGPMRLSLNADGILIADDGSKAFLIGIESPGGQRSVWVLDLVTSEIVDAIPIGSVLSGQILDFALTPNNELLYVSTGEVIDTATHEIVDELDLDEMRGLSFTPDGRYLVAGFSVFDVVEKSEVRPPLVIPEPFRPAGAAAVASVQECPPAPEPTVTPSVPEASPPTILPTSTQTATQTPTSSLAPSVKPTEPTATAVPTHTATVVGTTVAPPEPCLGDDDGDRVVTIAELIRAVRNSLLGCP